MRFISIASCLLALFLVLPIGAYETAAQAVATGDTTEYEITEVDWRARTYVGRRDTVGFDAVSDFFSTNLPAIYGTVQSQGMTVSGPATGLYWLWDMENMRTAMAAVVPVDQAPDDFENYEVIRVPAGRALVVDYRGHFDRMIQAHEALGHYIEANEMGNPSVVVEEYMTDPEAEPNPAKWHTRIIYVFSE